MSSDQEDVAGSIDDRVDSRHEHDGQGQAPHAQERVEDLSDGRDRLDSGHARGSNLPEPVRFDPTQPPEDLGEGQLLDSDEAPAELVHTGELPRIVLGIKADVQNIKNELHLHASPYSIRELRELREFDPNAYEMQLRRMERQHEHDLEMEKASVERPGKIATRGQYLALLVVLSVLALAAYALYEHEPWLAGVLGAIDLIGLATVFNASNHQHVPAHGDASNSAPAAIQDHPSSATNPVEGRSAETTDDP